MKRQRLPLIAIVFMLIQALPGHAQNANVQRPKVQLNIGIDGMTIDYTRLTFSKTNLSTYEIGTDMGKIFSEDAAYQIYSYDEKGARYAINVRPIGDGFIPLGIQLKTDSEAEISASCNLCNVLLIDKAFDITHDLSQGVYKFESFEGCYENRFRIKVLLLGDIDENGEVNSDDYKEIVQYLLGHPSEKITLYNTDINGDGQITLKDLVFLLSVYK